MLYIIDFIYYQSPWKNITYFSNHINYMAMLLFLKELCIVCHINYVAIISIIREFLLVYKNESAYYWNAVLCGCVSPLRKAVQYISTLFHINFIIYIGVLYHWCMSYARCRGTLSNGCVSPHWNCTLNGYSFYVHTIVVLSYTGAFRLVFMVLSIYVSHIPVVRFTSLHYIIDMNFDQNVVICQMGAFRPIRCTQHRCNFLITRDGI